MGRITNARLTTIVPWNIQRYDNSNTCWINIHYCNWCNGKNESIIITGTGLAPTDHNITGLEPVEPIFEEINWQMKTISVAVKNSESAEE